MWYNFRVVSADYPNPLKGEGKHESTGLKW